MAVAVIGNSEVTLTLHETCRLCLGQLCPPVTTIQIFTNESPVAPEEILNEFCFLKLKIFRDDGLPQQICNDCWTNVLNVREFQKICERSQEILEKFFSKTSTVADTAVPIKLMSDLSESNFSDFEFLNIDNVEDDNVEYDTKIEVIAVDESLISAGEVERIDHTESNENCPSDDNIDDMDDANSFESMNGSHDGNDNDETEYKSRSDRGVVANRPRRRNFIFQYNRCGKRFFKSNALQNHENEGSCVEQENPRCRFCKETFSSTSNLEEHLAEIHPIDRPHLCPICKKSFQSVSNRNTHLQSHNKDDTFKCNDCGQGFKSKVYLKKHVKSVHKVNDHDCPHCAMKFFNTTKFEYHLKSHDENKKYKCNHCDKSFLQHHHLANHERIHTNVRPFLCNICGKDFKQECNFKLHLRIHTGLRPYVCSVCGKHFIQRGSFVMHMKQHSGVRPYQCEHCGKDFIQKSSLTVHLRTHTGERPFKCDSCDKAFVQAQQLKYHRHSAHGGPSLSKKEPPPKPSSDGRVYPYCYSMCNKGFKLPSSLSSHMKIHNEERKHVSLQCGNSFKQAHSHQRRAFEEKTVHL